MRNKGHKRIADVKNNMVFSYNSGEDGTSMRIAWFDDKKEIIKDIFLLRKSDFFIAGENYNIEETRNSSEQKFTIPKDSVAYRDFIDLLQGIDKLEIEDDDTYEDKEKYVTIYKAEEGINFDFVNKQKDASCLDKYSIFIKNTLEDLRSKVDRKGLDTKDRLNLFFYKIPKKFSYEYSLLRYLDGDELGR